MLKRASRSRSAVGRIAWELGATSTRPRSCPPTMRISVASCALAGARAASLVAPVRARRPDQSRRRASLLNAAAILCALPFSRHQARCTSPARGRARPGLDPGSTVGAKRTAVGRGSLRSRRIDSRSTPTRLASLADLPRRGRYIAPIARFFRPTGPEKSAPINAAMRVPSWSRSVRVRTSSIAPGTRSPSWNGPNEMRIRRLTARPRWPSTFLTSRFFPSRMAKVSQILLPCPRSMLASMGP